MSSDQPQQPRAQSHQTGTIAQHWNDLPAGYIPSPTSSLSRSASRNSNTLAAGNSTNRGLSVSPLKQNLNLEDDEAKREVADGDQALDDTTELKTLEILLPALYNLPTTLSRNEHGLLQTRINKSLLPKTGDGGLTEEQRQWIRELLHGFVVVGGMSAKDAREEIVGFMRRESGVAGWAGSVRRLVENVVVPGTG
ncbi:hypothetical protein ABW19_dt0207645 [Dactylella cylindrospora]|nr:hypothetical protein ABW19_dt0207645 [Dactylella cylindrospora]